MRHRRSDFPPHPVANGRYRAGSSRTFLVIVVATGDRAREHRSERCNGSVMYRTRWDCVRHAGTCGSRHRAQALSGPLEAYAQGTAKPLTPFREEQAANPSRRQFLLRAGRRGYSEAARQYGFNLSGHRAAYDYRLRASATRMNMGVTLALYARRCKENGQPFMFSRFGRAMERSHGYDRRALVCATCLEWVFQRRPPRATRTSPPRMAGEKGAGNGCGRNWRSTSASGLRLRR